MSLLYLSGLCTPFFTRASDHGKEESDNSLCALFQLLGVSTDQKVQIETARKLRTTCVKRKSPQQSDETRSPGQMLRTLIDLFPTDYINENMGVESTTETPDGQKHSVKKHIIHIQDPGFQTMQGIITGLSVNGTIWSVKGDFFWADIDPDSCVDCEPELRTKTETWYMLGFISGVTIDQKKWVTTLRDHDTNNFLVMDHPTCQPKLHNMKYIGVHNPSLVLYGKKKPQPQSWLRPRVSSLPPGPHSSLFDLDVLEKDGLLTGSVDDLLTHCKCSPSLQKDLMKGIVDLLAKIKKERQGSTSCQSAIKVLSVNGWPMPNPNNVCLVYDSNGGSDPRAGSVRSTKDFGSVPLRTKATSPAVRGISLMVSSACDVFVQVDGVFFFRVYILTIEIVISCIRTSKIWNLLSHLHLETQSTHTHDNY